MFGWLFEVMFVVATLCGTFATLDKTVPYETDPGVECEIILLGDGSVTESCR